MTRTLTMVIFTVFIFMSITWLFNRQAQSTDESKVTQSPRVEDTCSIQLADEKAIDNLIHKLR